MPRRVVLEKQLRLALWDWNQPDFMEGGVSSQIRVRRLYRLKVRLAGLIGWEAVDEITVEVQRAVYREILSRPIELREPELVKRSPLDRWRWKAIVRHPISFLAQMGVPKWKVRMIRRAWVDRRFQAA